MSLISPGSGMFSHAAPLAPHLVNGPGGIAKEVNDLRADVLARLAPLAFITVEEIDLPVAAAPTGLRLSTLTSTSITHVTTSGFTGALGPGPVTPGYPRNVTLTTTDNSGNAGYTGSATITGLDIHGVAQTETIAITNNTTVAGKKAFSKITQIDIPAQPDALGHISFGTGSVLGLQGVVKARGGATTTQPPIKEIVNGATPTAGVLDVVNSTYTPNTAPNGTTKYAVYYERVGT